MNHYFYHNLFHHQILSLSITLGEILSVFVLLITAVAIFWQAWETRKSAKFLEYQIRPIAWFFLMSEKTLNKRDSKLDKNWFFVKNESKFKIFLYYKIEYKIDDNSITQQYEGPWSAPLHVYPGLMRYPEVIILPEELINQAKTEMKKIRTDIWYALAGDFAPNSIQQKSPETWVFDPTENIWQGPNGIPDAGFLSIVDKNA